MFDLEHHRLDYLSLLLPPDGFVLSRAVGTTYSLDLAALSAVAMALANGTVPSERQENNLVYLYSSLKALNRRVGIFYEKGLVRGNLQSKSLISLCEPLLQQVALPTRGEAASQLASFHPKIWVLEFEGANGTRTYRFLTMSRNLTFDKSMDVAVSLEGTPTQEAQLSTAPLADFLEHVAHLGQQHEDGSQNAPSFLAEDLARAIRTVRFEADGWFNDFEFLPLSSYAPESSRVLDAQPGGDDISLFATPHTRALIVSPFLSTPESPKSPLHRVQATEKRVLVTRPESLASKHLDAYLDTFECFVPKQWLETTEEEAEPERGYGSTHLSQLHAKLYLVEDADPTTRDLYLGSLNATANGVTNNVEFLLRLRFRKRTMTFEEVLGQLKAKDSLFEPANPAFLDIDLQAQDKATQELESSLHVSAKSFVIARVDVEPAADPKQRTVRIQFDYPRPLINEYPERTLEIRPASSERAFVPLTRAALEEGAIEAIALLDEISTFFELRITDCLPSSPGCTEDPPVTRHFVIQCPQEGFHLTEEDVSARNAVLLDSVITFSATALQEYISMALAGHLDSFADDPPKRHRSETTSGMPQRPYPLNAASTYEHLLKLASQDPDRLEQAKTMLTHLAKHDEVAELLELIGLITEAAGGAHAAR